MEPFLSQTICRVVFYVTAMLEYYTFFVVKWIIRKYCSNTLKVEKFKNRFWRPKAVDRFNCISIAENVLFAFINVLSPVADEGLTLCGA